MYDMTHCLNELDENKIHPVISVACTSLSHLCTGGLHIIIICLVETSKFWKNIIDFEGNVAYRIS